MSSVAAGMPQTATAWSRPSDADYIALVKAGAAQQPGAAARRENALAIYIPQNEQHAANGSVFVLAEGVGALPGSSIAATRAVAGIVPSYYGSKQKQPGNRLHGAIAHAAQVVHDQIHRDEQLNVQGVAFVCAVVVGDKLWLASSGSTRAYLLRPSSGLLQLLTLRQLLGEPGFTKPLGSERQPTTHHVGPLTLASNDILILCTDSLAGEIENGRPSRYLEMVSRRRAGADPQELADELIAESGAAGDSGAVLVVAASSIVPAAAAQRSGWPGKFSQQLTLPLANRVETVQPKPKPVVPTPPPYKAPPEPVAPEPPVQKAPVYVPVKPADIEPVPVSKSEVAIPSWIRQRRREALPGNEPVRPVITREAPRTTTTASSGIMPTASRQSHGAPQWLSHMVIVTALGILSTMAGVVIGLGPDYWLTAAGIAAIVIVVAALLLGILHLTRRGNQVEFSTPTSYRAAPREDEYFDPPAHAPVKHGRALMVSSDHMEYTASETAGRTPPVKVDILDQKGVVVGRLAVGAPEHLIDMQNNKPKGVYVLLYDAATAEERAIAWLAPGSQSIDKRPNNTLVLRDVTVAGEDPQLRVNWLRAGSVFTITSTTLAAELELLFYRYTDPLRKNTINSVQVGIRAVSRAIGGR